ncbi:hydroxyacid-oxoacid transhydrogenase, mitochondrial isoform X1 [Pteropus medius]|uniref:hydroxyacid-oxoacid transhydrogenase, mitochondrial isoform X1 n=2 Tax=Pteropus vampyrus TaxID=132908 RepID=UPI00196A4751|nr:hydroxyacid-oxoacid transhydrogenase, mitochondrial isoform X1 [Pteropus giganteus]
MVISKVDAETAAGSAEVFWWEGGPEPPRTDAWGRDLAEWAGGEGAASIGRHSGRGAGRRGAAMAAAARARVTHLLRQLQRAACQCPTHSHTYSQAPGFSPSEKTTDYAFEMAVSNIRYGAGVTKEVGMDLQNMGAKNVCLMTDKNLSQLPPVQIVMDSLVTNGINFKVYDNVRVEPTDRSFLEAIEFARKGAFDAYVAVGGGSTMDTCKAANLYASSLHSDFLDYVSAPIGKGKPVSVPLKPLIAVPTTSGTGSETTGIAIFDYEQLKVKIGIASRALKPTLGLVDPRHTLHMPGRVVANSGFDVLCHALESYSALPYHMRSPCPSNPIFRPAYQGSNPVSDIWAVQALRIVAKYLKRAVRNPDDLEARSNMHLASTFAGIGFGNAGVHLCHGMSYPISGLVKTYKAKDYHVDHPLVPHGLSVVLTSPAVFTFTAQMFPERHLEMAEILGADTRTARAADAGPVLADTLRKFLFDLDVDDGLAAIGYSKADIPALVKGTLPQERVTKLAPCPQSEEDLSALFEASMKLY